MKFNNNSIFHYFIILKIYLRGVLLTCIKYPIFYFYSFFNPIRKMILFSVLGNNRYGGNQRAICEKMHKLYPDYELVWILNSNDDKYGIIPSYIKIIKERSFDYYKKRATCFCFCTAKGINKSDAYKRNGQFFIQTWHADRIPKKIIYEKGEKGLVEAVEDCFVTDLCIAGSRLGRNRYASAFHYQGEILTVGMPKNDKLFYDMPKEREIIRKRLDLAPDEKVLLYAPTFRDGRNMRYQKTMLDLVETLNILSEDGGKWVALVRAHVGVDKIDCGVQDDRIRDVTDYPDMADLLQIADIMISDYSSSPGDFIMQNRPVFLFLSDKADYEKNCRELAFPLEETGFLIAYSQEELNRLIRARNRTDYAENCRKIGEYFGLYETGKSAEIICHRINAQWKMHEA